MSLKPIFCIDEYAQKCGHACVLFLLLICSSLPAQADLQPIEHYYGPRYRVEKSNGNHGRYLDTVEAAVDWALYDRDGLELAGGFTMATAGGPDWGDIAFTIPYSVTELQVGTLEVWETSAMDGSRTHLRETVVWLTP